MKFARQVLVDRVKAEIGRREAEAIERTEEAAIEWARTRAAYVANTKDAWNAFANTIKRRVRAGQPVATTDVPAVLGGSFGRNGAGYLQCWSDGGPRVWEPDVSTLQTLLVLLESTATNEINTTELERMGFKMGHLFRA